MSLHKYLLLAALFLASVFQLPRACAQTFSILYAFTGKADGALPWGGLTEGSSGTLYGTTDSAGYGGYWGSVYEVSTSGHFTLLHSFQTIGIDGAEPLAPPLVDATGNAYGTTTTGGTDNNGTVFKIDASHHFSVLYAFTQPWDQAGDFGSGLAFRDSAGNLYGAGGGGGGVCAFGAGCGMLFKVSPAGAVTVIHAFKNGPRGCYPQRGFVRDTTGNLYGTAKGCGDPRGDGVVFKLSPAGEETVLHTFTNVPDGASPNPVLILDAAGNLYGSTLAGGIKNCFNDQSGCGTIFKIDPTGNETILYRFTGSADGYLPSSLATDSAGNFYGTVASTTNNGQIFKLDTTGHESTFYSFTGAPTDGVAPVGLIVGSDGNFYGTAIAGGDPNGCTNQNPPGCGVVFKIVP
jgi:uncharacterized repeat protein (TIGR03803 family)